MVYSKWRKLKNEISWKDSFFHRLNVSTDGLTEYSTNRNLILELQLYQYCVYKLIAIYTLKRKYNWKASKKEKVSKLVTIVEGDAKAPCSIATTPRWRRGHNSFPYITPLYLWSTSYDARRHQVPFFESLVWLSLGLNPSLSGHKEKIEWYYICFGR